MAQERTVEELPFPPYFERFIDERDRRFIAELKHLGTRIQHNALRIDELRQEMERRFTEARDDCQAIREEIRQSFTRLDARIDSHFRWIIGLMIPIVLGVLAIIIRVFFFGFGPTP